MPETTYHIRDYVKTNKAEYFSNTMEVRSNFTASMEEATDVYTIPVVVFHLFPNINESYLVKEWMFKEQLDYANRLYSNYFGTPGRRMQAYALHLPRMPRTGSCYPLLVLYMKRNPWR